MIILRGGKIRRSWSWERETQRDRKNHSEKQTDKITMI